DTDSDNDNIPDMQEAWDNLADGDSEVDSGVGTCDGSDVDNDGLQDCFDSDTNSPLVTSYQSPVDDNGEEGAGTTASTTTSGDDPSEIFPNNDSGDGQPDFRDVLVDCGTPRVYYASTEASPGTITDYEFDGTNHVDEADTKVVRATTFCTPGDGWFYFYNPLEPENYLFALKNSAGSPNTVPISELVNFVELKVEEDRTDRHKIAGSEANLVLERDWNVSLKGTPTPGSTFDVKFYFPPAEMDSLSAAADDVEAMANGAVTREFYWFGKSGGVSNNDITSSTVTGMSDISANDPDNITDASANQMDGTVSTSGNGKNYVTFEGLTSLDGGSAGIKMTYASLPVELIRFVAKMNDCKAVLDWEAGSEENFSHYEIEKSSDGRNFTRIGQVASLNNTAELKYNFEDATPNARNYYRLKMMDLDFTFEYSNVVVVEANCGTAEMKLYPNPVTFNDVLTIDLQTQFDEAELVITDLRGKVVRQFTASTQRGPNTLRLDISGLPTGQYFMYNQLEREVVPVKFVIMKQ
ncbi:MAG: T9SS type A sorting domain-containing protein, partial [Saprospiraceae bacterium]